MMASYTIITCISDPTVYDECLLSSAYTQRGDNEINVVPVINHNNIYSASLALNAGLDACKTDIAILAHQDIKLLGDWFERLNNIINQIGEDWAIIGCAGIDLEASRSDIGRWGGSLGRKIAIGTVYDRDDAEQPYWDGIKDTTRAHCADECLIVLNNKTGLRFDQQFNGFHFYGVDLCLQARAAGFGVYCSDLPIIHYGKYSSSTRSDNKYWKYFRLTHRKWHSRFPELLGTHMHWAQDELTSYIPMTMSSGQLSVQIQSMGLRRVKL